MLAVVTVICAIVLAVLVLIAHRKRQAVLVEMRSIAERIDAKLKDKP